MPETISEVMTTNPWTVTERATIGEAARMMRDADIGDVIVLDPDGELQGIVTDRDVVVRAVAKGVDTNVEPVSTICESGIVTIGSEDTIEAALDLMRDHKVRRLPVVDDRRLVGIVTLGDLAMDLQPSSTLADISLAPPNN
jgi:CBS domain-containing protein